MGFQKDLFRLKLHKFVRHNWQDRKRNGFFIKEVHRNKEEANCLNDLCN